MNGLTFDQKQILYTAFGLLHQKAPTPEAAELYKQVFGPEYHHYSSYRSCDIAALIIISAMNQEGCFAPVKKTDWWHVAFVTWSIVSTIGGFAFAYFVYKKG